MSKPQARRTVPLTKVQLQTAAGAELLALCQTVTQDGSIHDEEVAALRAWLEENRSSDLPSIEFLIQTVEKILLDGRIDDWERRDLHKALERVLPPDARREASAVRKEVEAREYQARKGMEAREAKDDPRAFQGADRIGDVYDFMVAGVAHEGRSAIVDRYVSDCDLVFFFRDRANQYSHNAVEVRLANGLMIGFVPEEFAQEIAPLLDAGHPYHAWVKKILGYHMSIPVILAEVLRKDVALAFALREGQLPEPEGGGSRTANVLQDVSSDDSHSAFLPKALPALLRSDLEALNGRQVGLAEMESYVKACSEITPSLRDFLERGSIARAMRDVAITETNKGIRGALGQVRAALTSSLPTAEPSEAPRVESLIQSIDSLVATLDAPVSPSQPSAPSPPRATEAPQPTRLPEERPPRSRSSARLVLGVAVLVAIALVVLLAAARS